MYHTAVYSKHLIEADRLIKSLLINTNSRTSEHKDDEDENENMARHNAMNEDNFTSNNTSVDQSHHYSLEEQLEVLEGIREERDDLDQFTTSVLNQMSKQRQRILKNNQSDQSQLINEEKENCTNPKKRKRKAANQMPEQGNVEVGYDWSLPSVDIDDTSCLPDQIKEIPHCTTSVDLVKCSIERSENKNTKAKVFSSGSEAFAYQAHQLAHNYKSIAIPNKEIDDELYNSRPELDLPEIQYNRKTQRFVLPSEQCLSEDLSCKSTSAASKSHSKS